MCEVFVAHMLEQFSDWSRSEPAIAVKSNECCQVISIAHEGKTGKGDVLHDHPFQISVSNVFVHASDQVFQLLQSANLNDLLGRSGSDFDFFARRWISTHSFFCCWALMHIDLQQTW